MSGKKYLFVVLVPFIFLLISCQNQKTQEPQPEITVNGNQTLPKREFREYPLPEYLMLCGEQVPLGDRKIREMLDREFTISVWDHAQIFMWLKRAGKFFPYIEKELEKAGLPDDLKYLAVAESSLHTHIKSPAGALGLWQFMPSTARRYGLRKNRRIDERLNYQRSTEAAMKYFKDLKKKFGSWTLVMAAYNCGEGRLNREIKEQKVNDYYSLNLPLETERYVFRIAAIKVIISEPEKYGFHINNERIFQPVRFDSIDVKLKQSIDIAEFAEAIGADYKSIKELNPQMRDSLFPPGKHLLNVPPGLGGKVDPAVIMIASRKNSSKSYRDIGRYYKVKPGDTLSSISWKTGIPVSKIKKLNRVRGSKIWVGQKLRLKS